MQSRWRYGKTEKTPETGWDSSVLRTGEAVRQGGAQEGTQYRHGDLGGSGGDPKASGETLGDLGQTQKEVRKLQRT